MKKSLLALSVFAFSSTMLLAVQAEPLPGSSIDQHGGNPRWGEGNPEFRQKMLERFDSNHDGKLDDGERAQMREAMQERGMGEQNGQFSQRREEFREKMLQKFDTNHDGKLDDGERAQMREAMERRRMQEGERGGGFDKPAGIPQNGGDSQ